MVSLVHLGHVRPDLEKELAKTEDVLVDAGILFESVQLATCLSMRLQALELAYQVVREVVKGLERSEGLKSPPDAGRQPE